MSKRPVYSLPISAGQVKDPELQRILMPLINAWNVRNGQTGDGDEKFLTKQDLIDLLQGDAGIRGAVNGIANPPKPPKPPGDVGDEIRVISQAIFNDPLWIYLGESVDRIGENVEGVEVRLTYEEEARTNADTAIYNRIDKVVFGSTSPSYDDNGYPIFYGPTGAIQLTMTGLANDQVAIAELTNTVEAALQGYVIRDEDGNPILKDGEPVPAAATLEEKFQVIADTEKDVEAVNKDIANIYAQYTVKIDNQGYVSGFGLASGPAQINGPCNAGLKPDEEDYNDGICSRFYVRADVFAVGHPGGKDPDTGEIVDQAAPTVPFIIRNGTVYIDTAMIADATIDTAKIDWLYANKIVGALNKIEPITFNEPGWLVPKRHAGGAINFNLVYSKQFRPEYLPGDAGLPEGIPQDGLAYQPSATVSVEVTTKDGGSHEDSFYLKILLRNSVTGNASSSPVVTAFTKEAGSATVTHALGAKRTVPFILEVYVGNHHKDGVVTAMTGMTMAIR